MRWAIDKHCDRHFEFDDFVDACEKLQIVLNFLHPLRVLVAVEPYCEVLYWEERT